MKIKKLAFHLGYFLSCFGILFSVNSLIASENHNKGELTAAYIQKGTRIEINFENNDGVYNFPESNYGSLKFNADSYLYEHAKFYSESYVSESQNPFIQDESVKVLINDGDDDNYFGVSLISGNYPNGDDFIVSKELAEKYNITNLPTSISFSKKLNGVTSEETISISGIFDGENNKYVNKTDKNGNEATKYCIIGKNSENMQRFSAFNRVFEFLIKDNVNNAFLVQFGLSTIGGIRSIKAYDCFNSYEENFNLTSILSNWYSNNYDQFTLNIHVVSLIIGIVSLLGFILLNVWFFVKQELNLDVFMTCLIDVLLSVILLVLLNNIVINGKVLFLISHFSSLILLAEVGLIISVILAINIIAELNKNKKNACGKIEELEKSKEGLVSIIIPTFNGAKYLEHAIKSALHQTYKNIEIIVINDGSNDGGETDKLVKKYKDSVIYLKKKNGGVSTALNLGIENASGKFINWLSHDDELKPTSIEERMKIWIMYGNDEKVIVGSSVSFINEQDEVITRVAAKSRNIGDISDLLESTVNGCSLLIPKMAFENHKFTDGVIYMPDYYMWAELLNDGYSFINVPLKLVNSRIHSEQITLKHIDLLEKDFEEFFANYIECKFGKNKYKELRKIMMILKRRSHLHPFYKKYIDKIINNLKETNHFDFWDKLELGMNHFISWSVFIARKVMSK